MKILFIHQNMPGQYKHLAKRFGEDPDNQVVFITKRDKTPDFPGVTKVQYKVSTEPTPEIHRYLISSARAIYHGQEVWRVCSKLKNEEGFIPDVICVHPGWGEGLFLREIYPNTPVLAFQEFYYNPSGADVNFDPQYPSNADDKARIRIKNTTNIYGIIDCDWAVTPTFWQQSQFPELLHKKISVLHDGIDCEVIRPHEWSKIKIKGMEFNYGDEIVTYITRNFEPYRGFPTFAKAMEIVLKKKPKLHVIAVGSDGQGYGKSLGEGKVYRHEIMKSVDIDQSRMHFLGYLPHNDMLKILQISSAHIYLTVPFVLSWSTLEAMASGCLVIGSRTPPVEEVIQDGKNGLLVDFFSPEELADKVIYALDKQKELKYLREAARQTVLDRYDLEKVLPMHISLIEDMAARRIPPPAARKIEEFNRSNKLLKVA